MTKIEHASVSQTKKMLGRVELSFSIPPSRISKEIALIADLHQLLQTKATTGVSEAHLHQASKPSVIMYSNPITNLWKTVVVVVLGCHEV